MAPMVTAASYKIQLCDAGHGPTTNEKAFIYILDRERYS